MYDIEGFQDYLAEEELSENTIEVYVCGVKKYARMFGEITKSNIPKEVMHAHAFRHFFAIEFLKRNSNIALLADVLGHGSVNVTQLYLRQSQQQQKEAIDEAVNW